MSRLDQQDAVDAITAGVVTFAWYALPDAVASRPARAWAKVGLLLPLPALSAFRARRAQGADHDTAPDEASAPDDGSLARIRALTAVRPVLDASAVTGADDGRGTLRSASMVALGGLLAVGSIALTVAGERGIHRLGQRLGARGVAYPHSRIGLVSGVIAAGISVAAAVVSREDAAGSR